MAEKRRFVSRGLSEARSKAIYTRMAKRYDFFHHLQTLWADKKHRKVVIDLLSPTEIDLVLEIGVGTALATDLMINRYSPKFIVGLDMNPDMIKVGKERLLLKNNVQMVIANAKEIPIGDCAVDCAYSVYGIGGIDNPGTCISEIYRVLKPMGRISLLEMTEPPPLSSAIKRYIHEYITGPWIKLFWEFNNIDLEKLVEAAGFKLLRKDYRKDRLLGSATFVLAEKPV